MHKYSINDLPSFVAFNSIRVVSIGSANHYFLDGNEVSVRSTLELLGFAETQLPIRAAGPLTVTSDVGVFMEGAFDVGGQSISWSSGDTLLEGPLNGTGTFTLTRGLFRVLGGGSFSGTIRVAHGTLNVGSPIPTASISLIDSSGGLWAFGKNSAVGSISGIGFIRTDSSTLIASDASIAGSLDIECSKDVYGQLSCGELRVQRGVELAGARLRLSMRSDPAGLEGATQVILDNETTMPIVGTFAEIGEGSTIPVRLPTGGVAYFRLSYVGGDGNDVQLTAIGPAASIAATAGDPQNVLANAVFANMMVLVTDSAGNPVPNAEVTFTTIAGPTGASGVFTSSGVVLTNSGGTAIAPPLKANDKAGPFTVTAAVNGVTTPATFHLFVVAPEELAAVPALNSVGLLLLTFVLAGVGLLILRTPGE